MELGTVSTVYNYDYFPHFLISCSISCTKFKLYREQSIFYAQTFSLNVNFLFNMKLIVVAIAMATIKEIRYGTKFSTM